MSDSQTIAQSRSYPLKVMGQVLLLVFVFEGLIMLVLIPLSPWPPGSIAESVADSTLLSIALAPALWFIIVRPLRRVLQERGRLLRRVFEVQEVERRALARDLHDELGQHLTAMLVGLRSLQNSAGSEDVQQRAGNLLSLASESLKEVRRLASGLRVGVLEDFGLPVAVERLCEDFSDAHGMLPEISMKLTPGRRFGNEVETAIYRLVQESLTNIARHARAQNIWIFLIEGPAELTLTIRDDGAGFDGPPTPAPKGTVQSLGLRSMRERVELLEGSFRIVSSAGKGTLIEACVPIPEQPAAKTGQE